ncbi:MAG TPA: cupin domain-containing protein [Stellaceae bacterium]|nr:cupin domain-containing protein [Stellaceae bacterium]
MSVSFLHSHGSRSPIKIPEIGLDLFIRMPPEASGGEFCFIETINAPGAGPPRHRHPEAEVFRILEGRYLYEVDGRRFYAEAGDVVSIPGGVAHAFVNVTDAPARQYILITPALDAAAFFTELADTMRGGLPDRAALNVFGVKWQVDFLGPPLSPVELPAGP